MVGLYTRNDTFRCGGVLISDQFVLTAAHCFQYQVCVPIQKNCGFFMVLYPLRSFKILLYYLVTAYNAEQNAFVLQEDIAILKLKRPVKLTDHIQPICLPENCEEPSSIAPTYIAGWGLRLLPFGFPAATAAGQSWPDSYSGMCGASTPLSCLIAPAPPQNEKRRISVSFFSTAPLTLRQRNVTLIDKTACEEQLKRTVTDYIICSTEGSCRGDSGGPLMYENNGTWFLVGIYSGGDKDCFNSKGPGLYIKVSYYVSKLIWAFMDLGNNTEEHTRDNVFSTTGRCGRRHLKNTVSERIINGTEADLGDWPWMVGLYTRNDTFRCGGVLISDQFVLTAAHCFQYVLNSSVFL
ncbi:unnamed protein product [Ixodes persulcatus]